MKKKLTSEDIRLLLQNRGLDDYALPCNPFNIKKFIERYKEKNSNNIYINSDEYVSNLVKESYRLLPTRVEEFIQKFSSNETPIYWYDDAFWTLLTLRDYYDSNIQWDENGYTYISPTYKKTLVNYLKTCPSEGQFEGLSYFLNNATSSYFNLKIHWTNLAKIKKNKMTLENKSIYPFVLTLNDWKKETKYEVKKAIAISYFERHDAIKELKKIHEAFYNNVEIIETTSQLLNGLGEDVNHRVINFYDDEIETLIYVHKKYINPQALVQNKMIGIKDEALFIECLQIIVKYYCESKAIRNVCEWTEKWDEQVKDNKKVYKIQMEMNYEYQKSESKKWLQDALIVLSGYFLNPLIQEKITKNDLGYRPNAEEFYNFFNEFMDKALLKHQIENNLKKDSETIIKKIKI